IGSFSTEDIQEGLRTGKFLPTDLAWQEGMPDWRPLGEIMPNVAPAAAPGPGPGPGPAAVPVQPAAIVSPGVGAAATRRVGLLWERREETGFFKAFFDTVGMVLTKPAAAFTAMRLDGDMASPMLFALIGGSAGVIVALLFQMAFSSLTHKPDMFGAGLVAG